ncbi:sensor histidine kinase [Rhodomicrobium udaipurense]|uniref:histidine kinase n=1 Tax=Rhodomicrobium udaipurense TaxID=1202716 RepID=A0A8I1GDE5_9HYPH|nr:histidine kinase dimerization/phosphoacceptor domain -containing protein [Rhodomicrobium udaipurense]MBJ7544997.1 ATP-binding protein [Rhodomicrobium udaipurense]
MPDTDKTQVEELLDMPDLAEALHDDRFQQFLDKMPIAILVGAMDGNERIIYANPAFEKIAGLPLPAILGKTWDVLANASEKGERDLLTAIMDDNADHIGVFHIARPDAETAIADVYSSVIVGDDGQPAFRLVALIDVSAYVADNDDGIDFAKSRGDNDLALLELQHRVKNNLQLITALIRLESRHWPEGKEPLNRLAGRIEALAILYSFLNATPDGDEVDLGSYVSQLATAVMRTQAVEGVRLELKADVFPVSVNVAMPVGLVVNELLTNALKHAFQGREGGTITVECLGGEEGGRVVVADDGVGLPPETNWPEKGNLGALIVQTLKENAKAKLDLETSPGTGTRVTLTLPPAVRL